MRRRASAAFVIRAHRAQRAAPRAAVTWGCQPDSYSHERRTPHQRYWPKSNGTLGDRSISLVLRHRGRAAFHGKPLFCGHHAALSALPPGTGLPQWRLGDRRRRRSTGASYPKAGRGRLDIAHHCRVSSQCTHGPEPGAIRCVRPMVAACAPTVAGVNHLVDMVFDSSTCNSSVLNEQTCSSTRPNSAKPDHTLVACQRGRLNYHYRWRKRSLACADSWIQTEAVDQSE
jgi:hypothetical protein